MPVAALVLVILLYVYLLISKRELRKPLLAGGVVAMLLVLILTLLVPSESTNRTTRVSLDDLTIDELILTRTERGATISGRMQNGSSNGHIREVVIDMRLFDCAPGHQDLDDCLIIGDASAIARPSIPPGQTRGFTAQFLFSNLPVLSGELAWTLTPAEIRATQAGG